MKGNLPEILGILNRLSGLTVRYLDGNGEVREIYGEDLPFCVRLREKVFSSVTCPEAHKKAALLARQTGEAYIFVCPAGLVHISYPVVQKGELTGSILLGPFSMESQDGILMNGTGHARSIQPDEFMELNALFNGIVCLDPQKVQDIGRLLTFIMESVLDEESAEMRSAKEKFSQLSRINENIQMYKEQGKDSVAEQMLQQKETLLLTRVRTGNVQEAKAVLNDLLGYVLFSEGGKVESIRDRAMTLITLLSRVALEGGAPAEEVYGMSSAFLGRIRIQREFEEICYLLQDVVERFMSIMFTPLDKGNPHIRKVLGYIAGNYSLPLTLESVADAVGLSPSYLSRLFHEVVGVGFRDYLNRVRIEESKPMLEQGEKSLAEIAVSLGFGDQSYFSKVFKHVTGMTPGKYRE